MLGVPMSDPAVTFCQLTITTPLNRAGSLGRTTYIRVRYAAVAAGSTVHRPSRSMVDPGEGTYVWAVPSRRNSFMRYPCSDTSDAGGDPNGQPLPPSSGPVTRAIGVFASLIKAPSLPGLCSPKARVLC